MTPVFDVSTQSGERSAMEQDLQLIADIREGAVAVRRGCGRYLPQYEMESAEEYRRRVAVAPWRPEFADALRTLASEPFGADVTVADDTPEQLAALVEDIDGKGSNLTRFARQAFTEALANGVHGILVDYPALPDASRPLSLAEERRLGLRPYWVQVPVTSIIALRTAVVKGREIVTHLRIREDQTLTDGFGEKTVKRIRVVEPGRWELWERNDQKGAWLLAEEGIVSLPPELGVPLALFFTGDRLGQLRTRPPLRDLAEVQIELFRALSRQDEILTYSGSPMLAALGMAKPADGDQQIRVGPKTILFAPPSDAKGGSRWEYVSPDAAAIGEIRQQIAAIVQDMRRLGMQPMTERSGRETATAASIEASKAHSALQAWAGGLKDCLEHAFGFTARWLNLDHQTAVSVFTDFAIGDQNTEESKIVLQAQGAFVISKATAREELRRRNILGPQYDPAKDVERLAEERGEVASEPTAVVLEEQEPAPAPEAPSEALPQAEAAPKRRWRTKP